MTPPKLLDEVALRERELLIINAAVLLIQQNGIENLTMDKVVAQVPFSKGTVYKHFIGKEDLLLAISNHSMGIMADLFFRAYQFKGCARARMLLLNFSYLIYAILYPALFQCVLCAKSPNVVGKSSDKHINENEQIEIKLMTSIHGIVEEGITGLCDVITAWDVLEHIHEVDLGVLITNIRNKSGDVLFSENLQDGKCVGTVYEVTSIAPVFDAFDKIDHYKIILARSDNQEAVGIE